MGCVFRRPRARLSRRVVQFLVFSAVVAAFAACDDSAVSPEKDIVTDEPGSVLRSKSDLSWGCYEQRPDDPTFIDKVQFGVALTAGDTAYGFSLRDVDGREYDLRALLESRPVVLIFGSYS